ncbi:hypothetical protein F511_38761 [Dorcoceras hygrometricum]|uniref:Uncharacterized protein n=1 Tax=Dorcoceras hygrometricum TaxID=472368 RepID=A0A2Z7CSS6_9LAMI|nr:hypothetical protein F511_44965 [Dorcoceras hygrometricum]KZV47724.1 hypothetical protein F511_38761 [Dorcoceras hygrometricum]
MHAPPSPSDTTPFPPIFLSAPATMAGAPPAGPPPGAAAPNLTNPGPSHAPHGSNEGKETQRTSRPSRYYDLNGEKNKLISHAWVEGYVDLRGTGVEDARSGRNRLWIAKLLQWRKVRIL